MEAWALGAESWSDETGFKVQVVNQDEEAKTEPIQRPSPTPAPMSERVASEATSVHQRHTMLLGLLMATALQLGLRS